MTWDIALNSRGTIAGGIVTGDDEILQRLWIRLNRELGEWFLNTEVGLPWYQNGYGILGSKPQRKNDIDLLLRQEISRTEGVLQILKYNAIYASGTRVYDVYCQVLLRGNRVTEISFGVAMDSQGGTGMPVIPASFIKFENGKTLQDLYDSGELQGPEGLPGEPGLDGQAATIVVGSTQTLESGSNAYVKNVGGETAAVLEFGIPYGAAGPAGAAATVTVGSTVTVPAGTPASVTNTGTESDAVLEFSIPDGGPGEKGDPGPAGAPATITIGTTSTVPAGTPASVTNTGTESDAVLEFSIPEGEQGEKGPKGDTGSTANINLRSGDSNLTVTSSSSAGVKTFTIKTDGGVIK